MHSVYILDDEKRGGEAKGVKTITENHLSGLVYSVKIIISLQMII
jgi:hypothetical protein